MSGIVRVQCGKRHKPTTALFGTGQDLQSMRRFCGCNLVDEYFIFPELYLTGKDTFEPFLQMQQDYNSCARERGMAAATSR